MGKMETLLVTVLLYDIASSLGFRHYPLLLKNSVHKYVSFYHFSFC